MSDYYNKVFSHFYDFAMASIEKNVLHSRRKNLLSHLEGKILEVGCGTGINFPLYLSKADVLAIEPSPNMCLQAKQRMILEKPRAEITVKQVGIDNNELSQIIEPHSLDTIVCTLVLCSIPNPKKAIEDFKYYLKPNGKLIVMEHIKSNQLCMSTLQNVCNPIWNLCADGCHLNRETDQYIKNAGFMPITEEVFHYTIPFYTAELSLSPESSNKN